MDDRKHISKKNKKALTSSIFLDAQHSMGEVDSSHPCLLGDTSFLCVVFGFVALRPP